MLRTTWITAQKGLFVLLLIDDKYEIQKLRNMLAIFLPQILIIKLIRFLVYRRYFLYAAQIICFTQRIY